MGLLTTVENHVSLEGARLCNGFVTHLAGVGLLTAVEHHVSLEVICLCEGFVTHLGRGRASRHYESEGVA
jgi:hypothetical protein